jgi:hypothetical protein
MKYEEKDRCMNQHSGGKTCSLKKGHTGNHEAYELWERWPNTEEAKVKQVTPEDIEVREDVLWAASSALIDLGRLGAMAPILIAETAVKAALAVLANVPEVPSDADYDEMCRAWLGNNSPANLLLMLGAYYQNIANTIGGNKAK